MFHYRDNAKWMRIWTNLNNYKFGALYKWVRVKCVLLEKYEKSESMAPLIRFSMPIYHFLYSVSIQQFTNAAHFLNTANDRDARPRRYLLFLGKESPLGFQ